MTESSSERIVAIDVLEKGKAVQMGRFNQGGKMQIFEDMAMAT